MSQIKQPSAALYLQLKQDIVAGKLPEATALKQEELAQRYGVSRIPIRDVLNKLTSEGWLVPCGKRGVMLQPLNATEAADLSLMRQYLEPMLLGLALPHINHQIIGQATDLLEQLDKHAIDNQQYGELNWQFHATLYHPAGRPTLFNTVRQLNQMCARYIGFHALELQYEGTSQNEHYQLLDALKSKQGEKAQAILKSHIRKASKLLVNYLNQEKN